MEELEKITEFHIVQNPWTLEQLHILGPFGWRTDDNNNWNTHAYKRKTILKNLDRKYWVVRENNKERIVLDSTISDGYKKVFVESRKYVPIFYDEYMDFNGLPLKISGSIFPGHMSREMFTMREPGSFRVIFSPKTALCISSTGWWIRC